MNCCHTKPQLRTHVCHPTPWRVLIGDESEWVLEVHVELWFQTALANCGGNCICTRFFKCLNYIHNISTHLAIDGLALLKIIGLQWSQTSSFQLLPYPGSEVWSLGDIITRKLIFCRLLKKSIKKNLSNVKVMLHLISNIKAETSSSF